MDQRRLANDPDFPTQTVTRVFKGTTYTLEPGAVRYTFPMGEKYLEENPEIRTNKIKEFVRFIKL